MSLTRAWWPAEASLNFVDDSFDLELGCPLDCRGCFIRSLGLFDFQSWK